MYLPEAPPPSPHSLPYRHYPRPPYLGQDEGSTKATISWSAIWKAVFVGVATTLIAEILRKGLYAK